MARLVVYRVPVLVVPAVQNMENIPNKIHGSHEIQRLGLKNLPFLSLLKFQSKHFVISRLYSTVPTLWLTDLNVTTCSCTDSGWVSFRTLFRRTKVLQNTGHSVFRRWPLAVIRVLASISALRDMCSSVKRIKGKRTLKRWTASWRSTCECEEHIFVCK